MKKKIIYGIGACLLLVALVLPFTRADKHVAYDVVAKEVEKIAKTYEKDVSLKDKKFIRKVYELNDSDYVHVLSYGANSAMEVNEICVAQFKNETQKERIKAQFQTRVDQQYKSFAGYAPRQAQYLKDAVIMEADTYVFLIVHEKSETMKEDLQALF